MRLSELLTYKKIVIQCHDAPDADSIGTGYALYTFFTSRGCEVTLAYGGLYQAEKPNILAMIRLLNIPIQYRKEAPECDLLLLVDCQYDSGNAVKWEAPKKAVIDHHRLIRENQTDYSMIRSHYGSCSTLAWAMLREEGVDVNQNLAVATALYYGLYMDTARFSEISHPMDRDMRDSLRFEETVFFKLINTNLTAAELSVFADAIKNYRLDPVTGAALVPVGTCDPNILGIVSDFIIQVSDILLCTAYMEVAGGCRLSIRSCTEEVRADELAQFFCQNMGSGGGHVTKSGGFLSEFLFKEKQGEERYGDYLSREQAHYFASYQIIRAGSYEVDMQGMDRYIKRSCLLGATRLTDVVGAGTPVLIRTLEGDLECVSADNLFIMTGIDGEVYPIQEEKFERTYEFCEGTPEYKSEYEPTVHNILTGEVYLLKDQMRTCRSRGSSAIFARQLDCGMKIFTLWDEHKYLKGEAGDYLAVRQDDLHDVYIIRDDIFKRSYEPVIPKQR